MEISLHKLIGTKSEAYSHGKIEYESIDLSAAFYIVSSLIHSCHFLLNLRIKEITFNQLSYKFGKLTLYIIKYIFLWDRQSLLLIYLQLIRVLASVIKFAQ